MISLHLLRDVEPHWKHEWGKVLRPVFILKSDDRILGSSAFAVGRVRGGASLRSVIHRDDECCRYAW